MRRFLRPLALTSASAVLSASVLLSAQSAPAPAAAQPSAAAPSVDALVAKNMQAKGGEAKLKAVQSMRMTGRASIQGMEVPMSITVKRPNLSRQEITIQDKKLVQAYDGDKAWMINPMLGSETPQELSGPQADMAREQADFDGALMDWKSKGHTVEYVGTEDVGGAKAHKLKVTKKSGQVQYFFLDADSGIDLKTSFQVPQGANTVMAETELSDYRPIEGIMVPHTLKTSINGMPMASITVDKIELNIPVDDALFKMPKP